MMAETAAVFLQARMGSTRLPGKVLARVAGASLLELCVRRLQCRSQIPVVVLTTTLADDDRIEEEAKRLGVDLFRGPDIDVLSRFVAAADRFGVDDVIRATADNPAVDSDAPQRTLTHLRRAHVDYVHEYGLPYGAGVEAVTADSLRRSSEFTADPYDREHVTPLVRRDPRFAALAALVPGDVRNPELRLTVDTSDDLEYIRVLFEAIGGDITTTPLADIITGAMRLRDSRAGGSGARGAR
jgi:spore coat polysaccharide biosynthesis protein SpsF